jgi:hypothetical protein
MFKFLTLCPHSKKQSKMMKKEKTLEIKGFQGF